MDYSDFPTEEKKPPVKLIAIIGGSVVALIIIVFVVVRLISGSPEPIDLGLTGEVDNQTSCENADDKAGCEADLLKSQSEENGDVALCDSLEGNAKDDCIWGVASEMADEGLCKKIANLNWVTACQDGINRELAFEKKKDSFCDKIQDEEKKTSCKDELSVRQASEDCLSKDKETDYCKMLVVIDEAIVLQDKEHCNKLSGDFVGSCKASVTVDDPDFDGIPSEIEYNLYRSDPRNKDTDGDGYSDLAEIEAGFSPTGPGTLY